VGASKTRRGTESFQADEIVRGPWRGAPRGVKVLKNAWSLFAGEYFRGGRCLKIDDARFDSMWETCGSLGIPVAIHVSESGGLLPSN